MPYNIIRENIVKLKVDAIVNAANNQLQAGGGVCGAIFSAAGENEMQQACDEIGFCETGNAVITKGYKLPAKYVIHAVGPVFIDGSHNEESLLFNTYKSSLLCAKNNNLKSIALPLISTGIYGYPKDKALNVATRAIAEFLLENDMDVSLVVYDKSSFLISQKLFKDIKTFIDENFEYEEDRSYNLSDNLRNKEFKQTIKEYKVEESRVNLTNESEGFSFSKNDSINEITVVSGIFPTTSKAKLKRKLEDIKIDETFQEMLIRIINKSEKTDPEIYKAANIDRRLFSKIISDKYYKPSKKTAIALAISLRLSLDETKDLLEKAGFVLSHSQKFDLVIEYFIIEENYDIFEINNALYEITQKCLVGIDKN